MKNNNSLRSIVTTNEAERINICSNISTLNSKLLNYNFHLIQGTLLPSGNKLKKTDENSATLN